MFAATHDTQRRRRLLRPRARSAFPPSSVTKLGDAWGRLALEPAEPADLSRWRSLATTKGRRGFWMQQTLVRAGTQHPDLASGTTPGIAQAPGAGGQGGDGGGLHWLGLQVVPADLGLNIYTIVDAYKTERRGMGWTGWQEKALPYGSHWQDQ